MQDCHRFFFCVWFLVHILRCIQKTGFLSNHHELKKTLDRYFIQSKHVMKLISIFSGMNKKCISTKNATLAIGASIGIDWRVFCSGFSPAFLVIQGPRHTIGVGYSDPYFTNAVQSWICYFQKLFVSAGILSINIMAIIYSNSLKTILNCYSSIPEF